MKTIIKATAIIVLIAILAPISFMLGTFMWGAWYDQWSGFNSSFYAGDGFCNVGVMSIYGEISSTQDPEYLTTTPTDIRSFLSAVEYDSAIKAVMFEIDSPGGYPAASADIAFEIKEMSYPNLALIGDQGLSGGYLAASAADHIIASPFADVGSIGVTMSYLSSAEKNKAEGLEYVELTSAPFKDAGTPDRPLTAEERALFQEGLDTFHDEFVKQVAENRGLPFDEVASLANGSSYPAPKALEHKLIDEIGNRANARAYFANVLQIPEDEVVFCTTYVPPYLLSV